MSDPGAVELRPEFIEQSRLADAGGAFDLDQRHALFDSSPDGLHECVELVAASDEADTVGFRARARAFDQAREKRADVLLADDCAFECPCLNAWLEAKLFVEVAAVVAVAVERFVHAPECVERKHLRALGAFAEVVERYCRLGVRERSSKVQLRQRSIGRV